MRIRLPRWYEKVMDKIACAIFPPAKPIGLRIASHDVTWLDLTLTGYSILMGIGFAWFLGHWVWLPITLGSMLMMAIWMW